MLRTLNPIPNSNPTASLLPLPKISFAAHEREVLITASDRNLPILNRLVFAQTEQGASPPTYTPILFQEPSKLLTPEIVARRRTREAPQSEMENSPQASPVRSTLPGNDCAMVIDRYETREEQIRSIRAEVFSLLADMGFEEEALFGHRS